MRPIKRWLFQRPGHEVSRIEDRPIKTTPIPTIDDLANFTAGFETFRPDIYQVPKSDGSGMQDLTGMGFADKESLELARQGKMTRDVANKKLLSFLNREKNDWLNLLPETANLPIEAQYALWDISYNGKGVSNTIKNSPNLVAAIKAYKIGDRASLENIVKHMDHSKSAGGWLGVRSAARRAMALGEYKWNWPTVDKYGRQVDYNQYKGPQDYKSSPYFKKYQKGGIIYKPLLEENDFGYKQQDLNYYDFDIFNSRFPVEPVVVYTPQKEVSTKVEETPVVKETPIVEETTFTPLIPKGTIEYKSKDIDLGNMKELVELMRDEGISFRITSGSRPGSKTSNGSISHHSSGNALDITPIQGQSWDDLIKQMRKSKRFISYMQEHNLGILDERTKKMQAKTGATGAHFHIGPDQMARIQFKYLMNDNYD